MLSERRVFAPNGMAGGGEAKRGLNLWVRNYPGEEPGATRTINIGGKARVQVNKGDRIIVMTPGGGGYGKDPDEVAPFELKEEFRLFPEGRKSKVSNRGSVANRQTAAQSN